MRGPSRRLWSAVVGGICLLGLAVAGFAGQVAEPRPTPTTRPFLWRIEVTPPSYLYGTIHLPDDRVLALPKAVQDSFTQADVFCSEVPMDRATQEEMASAALLPNGQTLSELLPGPLYERTEHYLARRGLPIVALERQKVWAVATTLSLLDYLEVMLSKPVLDLQLYQRAAGAGKHLDALETVQDQIRIMDGIELPGQIALLEQTLGYLEDLDPGDVGPVEKLIVAYVGGDEKKLFETAFEYADMNDPLTIKFLDALVYQRNRRMAEGIEARIKARPAKSYFFAIGSLHIPGADGVAALLTKRGHRLTRVISE